MKTTLDIPERLLRETKAAAALQGQSMREFVQKALEDRLRGRARRVEGWRSVFGKARRAQVVRVDEIISDEFSRIDLESWR